MDQPQHAFDAEQLRKLFEMMQRIGFDRALEALQSEPAARSEKITVRSFYGVLLPDYERTHAPGTLKEYRNALNHWERLTTDPDLRDIGVAHLVLFRDGLVAEGLRPASVNKVWRHVRAILQQASDDGIIRKVPMIARRSSLRLMDAAPKMQRECITEDELSLLWRECRRATYPQTCVPAPKLWRVALVLFWFYGVRTRDLFDLRWENVLWNDRLVRFKAHKTRKVQGLPLNAVVIEHLQSLRKMCSGYLREPHCPVLPGFNSTGTLARNHRRNGVRTPRKRPYLKRGYYATWNYEIHRHAAIEPAIKLKNFRESMVTRYNGIEPGLGGWIAGHFVPGVSAQSYDLPTERIRTAIESAPVPKCFSEVD